MKSFKNKRIHFVGIGGISLSALACFVKNQGAIVSGSDLKKTKVTDDLEARGIKIFVGHRSQNVCGVDVVFFSGAIGDDNPEIEQAMALGIPTFSRAWLLGKIAEGYKNVIAVSGSHGKTTTTGMIASCLLGAKKDPTIHIGGVMKSLNSNFKIGGENYFVTEACEYKDSFLSIKNQAISCVLNVQEDHMDYFKTKNNLQKSFQIFIKNTNKNGICVINADDEYLENFLENDKMLAFGIKNRHAFVRAKSIRECKWSRFSFDLFVGEKKTVRIKLPVVGRHQIYNALACVAVCLHLGLSVEEIKCGLENFSGIKRRFERVGDVNGATIFHDYAHHPTEIQANIKATKKFTKGKVFVVFQPHTFSRTRDLWKEFVTCFDGADEVCIFKIYPAREYPIDGIDEKSLSEAIGFCGVKSTSLSSFGELKEYLNARCREKDVVLILGAGDIEDFCEEISIDNNTGK